MLELATRKSKYTNIYTQKKSDGDVVMTLVNIMSL